MSGRKSAVEPSWKAALRAAKAGARSSGRGADTGVAPERSATSNPTTTSRPAAASGVQRKPSVAFTAGMAAVKGSATTPNAPAPGPTLRKTGPFKPNPLLFPSGSARDDDRVRPAHDGVAPDLLTGKQVPKNEAELILGLDFGTSSVKAVIRDRFAGRAFAVPFTTSLENPYLLPSHVFRTDDSYSLDRGVHAKRDLKLRLLGCPAKAPVEEFNDACAFLALVIRRCRGWLLDTHALLYQRVKMRWSLNVGLPAASYGDDAVVRTFRRLAWAAANLASQEGREITHSNCDDFRQLSHDAYAEYERKRMYGSEFEYEDVDVVPEIAAQIYGFVTSAKWDWKSRPMMMLVDIGAGTVDAAFFSFTRYVGKERRFAFFANDVQPNGVMNLHRERVTWLRDAALRAKDDAQVIDYLDEIRLPTDRTAPIPEQIDEYLPGREIICPAGQEGVDRAFYKSRYYKQVATCCGNARRTGIPDCQLVNVPCFLTGGGSRLDLYGKVIADISSNTTVITLERMTLTTPSEDLVCPGLRVSDFDRLSVAYGLSWHGADGASLGKVVRATEMRLPGEAPVADWTANYVSKEMT